MNQPRLSQPAATIIAAVITLAGVVLGHILLTLDKKRDREVKNG